MTQPEIDPVDHHRTTRQHAGETMKNGTNAVGIIAVALGVIALVAGLAAFATGNTVAGAVSVVIAVVLGGGGLTWLQLAHRRVRAAELRWHQANSDEPAPPPAS